MSITTNKFCAIWSHLADYLGDLIVAQKTQLCILFVLCLTNAPSAVMLWGSPINPANWERSQCFRAGDKSRNSLELGRAAPLGVHEASK